MTKEIQNTNYTTTTSGLIVNTKNKKELSWIITRGGYARVRLHSKWYLVHRIVAKAFISNPDHKPVVNHKDGNKLNNEVSNLEWVTREENERHAQENGFKFGAKGTKNGMSKLNEKQVKQIRKLLTQGVKQREIAILFGVSRGHISGIKLRFWKHL